MSDMRATILVVTIVTAILVTMVTSGLTQLRYSCEHDDQWMTSSGACIDPDTVWDAARD